MEIGTIDDGQQIRACFVGKTEAFGKLVQKYQSYICSLTYSSVGDLEKSEELAQEVFIIAWNNLSQLRDTAKFKSWLYHITKNQINHFFRRKKKDLLSKAASIDAADSAGTMRDDPVLKAISKERQQVVWDALNQIPVQYREPLVLFYREGKSVRQVAQFFDLTEGAAKKRLSRARAMVKANIQKDLETTVSGSLPGKPFATSVVALIAAGTVINTASASAATVAVGAAGSKGAAVGGWLSVLSGGMAAKAAIAAAVIAVTVTTGSYVVHSRNQPEAVPAIQVLSAELETGQVLYFSFDYLDEQDRVTTIIDESYNGNDGILMGGEFVKGKIGNALRCKDKNKSDGVIVEDHASLNLDAVTITAWIKTDHVDGQWNRILDKGYDTAYNLCIGGIDLKGRPRHQDRAVFECAKTAVISKFPVTDNRWHFVAATYDGRVKKIYIDGKLDNQIVARKNRPLRYNAVDLRIGQLAVPEPPPYQEAFFDGLIDEIRLFNRVLTEEEVNTLYRYNPGY